MKKLSYIVLITLLSKISTAQEGGQSYPPSVGTMAGMSCTINTMAIIRANCNIIYFCYDASGNRIARYVPICMPSGGGSGIGGWGGAQAMAPPINDRVIDTGTTLSIIETTMIFPNPTMGPTQIVLPKEMENVSIVLINLDGKILENRLFSGKQVELNLTSYPAGTYYIIVSTDIENVKKAIIKQ